VQRSEDGCDMRRFSGGSRARVHLCVLFNLFVKYGYVLVQFMKSVIVPLVKCKTGDLSDVNSYRAIAISTSISKLFENVLAVRVKSCDYFDAYQFGFTPGCSTSLCTGVLSVLSTATLKVVVMYLRAFWISAKLLTKSVTGSCFISY